MSESHQFQEIARQIKAHLTGEDGESLSVVSVIKATKWSTEFFAKRFESREGQALLEALKHYWSGIENGLQSALGGPDFDEAIEAECTRATQELITAIDAFAPPL